MKIAAVMRKLCIWIERANLGCISEHGIMDAGTQIMFSRGLRDHRTR